jgi:glutathione S-transferase
MSLIYILEALYSQCEKVFLTRNSLRGLVPGESASGSKIKYTVPAIQHVPTNTYIMDSTPIAQFLESTYPHPPIQLTSELGREIETKARGGVVSKAFRASVMPRELGILSPLAQEYFRRTREASLGHRLEDLLDGDKEEQAWNAVSDDVRVVGELLQTNKADGPFVLGGRPSYTDFFIAGSLQCARMVDEGVFQRIIKYPGYGGIYEACLPYMEKRD